MEYAVLVWRLIPGTLADKLETVQKRALRIIFPPTESYNEALQRAQLDSLATRLRHFLCLQYMDKIKVKGHPLHNHLPKRVSADCLYGLKKKQDDEYLFKNCVRCKTKRSGDFFMLKYFELLL